MRALLSESFLAVFNDDEISTAPSRLWLLNEEDMVTLRESAESEA